MFYKKLLIHFFSFSWKTVCPGSGNLYASRDEKSVSSRNYPNPYWGNVQCSWRIEADPDYVIRLTVQALYIEDCEPNCYCDYLEVFNGSSSSSYSLGRWCGRDTPDLLSSGRDMFLVMRTNLFISDQGFKAVYSSIHKREDTVYMTFSFSLLTDSETTGQKFALFYILRITRFD